MQCIHPSRFVTAADGTRFDAGYGVPDAGCALLKGLVLRRRPKVIVEIGMALGFSTVSLAEAVRELAEPCRYIVIDPFQERIWKNAGLTRLHSLGLKSQVEFHPSFSHIVASELETAGVKVDFAFVDGNHLFDYVIADFVLLDRIMSTGGLMIFDDVQWASVRKAMRFILRNCNHYRALTEESGVVVPWRPRATDQLRFALGRRLPRALRRVIAPEVWAPSWDLGVRGRFLIVEKQSDDPRGDQEMFHCQF